MFSTRRSLQKSNLYRIVFLLMLTLLVQGCSTKQNQNVIATSKRVELYPVKLSDVKFPYPDLDAMQFFIQRGKLLHKNSYSKNSYEMVVKDYVSTFGADVSFDTYESLKNLRKEIFKTVKENSSSGARIAQNTVLSAEATVLSNAITNF